MKALNLEFDRLEERGLKRVIEPLASYVCAADQPRVALLSALTLLFNEMEQTNRVALAHFGAVPEHRR